MKEFLQCSQSSDMYMHPCIFMSLFYQQKLNSVILACFKSFFLNSMFSMSTCSLCSSIFMHQCDLSVLYNYSLCEFQVSGLTIISESDWKCFCEEWSGIETKGISARIENVNDSENALTGSCREMPICEDQLNTWDKVNNESGNGHIVIKTCPEVI